MRHYTCPECGHEQDTAGTCQDDDCLRQGQELFSCDCRDGEHGVDDEDDYAR